VDKDTRQYRQTSEFFERQPCSDAHDINSLTSLGPRSQKLTDREAMKYDKQPPGSMSTCVST